MTKPSPETGSENIDSHSQTTSTRFSVPFRLNMLNTIVLISGLLSVFGAYEIQLGGTMHKLNFFHAKYNHILTDQIRAFEDDVDMGVAQIKETIFNIRQQPIDCLNLTKSIDRFVMRLIGTEKTLEICENDTKLADAALAAIEKYEKGQLEHLTLVYILQNSAKGFFKNGQHFEPLVAKTVKYVFLSVFIVIFAKAILVPLFGVYLSTGVSRDYKELKKTKDALLKEKQRNEHIQDEKMLAMSTMVSGLAHEVNTPLGIAVTASSHFDETAQQLRKRYQDGSLSHQDMEHFFSVSEEAGKILTTNLRRSSELISSFKMVVVDQSTDDARTIDLKAYLQDVLLSLSPKLRRTQYHVKLECPDNINIVTFPGTLSQIITNLVTNSLVHAFENKSNGVITITVKQLRPDLLQLTYSDDGHGIPATTLNRIFDPFFTTKRNSGGTGLGLHILHNLVTQKLNGKINCESNEGRGTKFIISWCPLTEKHPSKFSEINGPSIIPLEPKPNTIEKAPLIAQG